MLLCCFASRILFRERHNIIARRVIEVSQTLSKVSFFFPTHARDIREKTAGLPFVKKDRRKKFERKLVRKKRFDTCVVAHKRLEI